MFEKISYAYRKGEEKSKLAVTSAISKIPDSGEIPITVQLNPEFLDKNTFIKLSLRDILYLNDGCRYIQYATEPGDELEIDIKVKIDGNSVLEQQLNKNSTLIFNNTMDEIISNVSGVIFATNDFDEATRCLKMKSLTAEVFNRKYEVKITSVSVEARNEEFIVEIALDTTWKIKEDGETNEIREI